MLFSVFHHGTTAHISFYDIKTWCTASGQSSGQPSVYCLNVVSLYSLSIHFYFRNVYNYFFQEEFLIRLVELFRAQLIFSFSLMVTMLLSGRCVLPVLTSLLCLSCSSLREKCTRVGRICCCVAANLQWLPQLYLLFLDKPKFPQEILPHPAEAHPGLVPKAGRYPWVLLYFTDPVCVSHPE